MKNLTYAVLAFALTALVFVTMSGVETQAASLFASDISTAAMLAAGASPRFSRNFAMSAPRADGSNVTQMFNQLQQAFAAFRDDNDKRLSALEKGKGDVVQDEKVDRINAEITNLQRALDEQNRRMASLSMGAGAGLVNPQAQEHAQAFNQYFRRGVDANLQQLAVNAALQTGSDPDGGYVVPAQMDAEINRVLTTVSAMRAVSRNVTIGSASFKKLHNMGGAGSGWVGETAPRTETNTPQLSQLEFPAMELYANPAATQQLLDDASLNIESWLADEVAIQFAEQEAAAFVNGDGVNRPRGLLAYNKVAQASYVWGSTGFVKTGANGAFGGASQVNAYENLVDTLHALRSGYRSNARWLMADATFAAIRKLKDTTGQPLWQGPVQADAPFTILGKPVATDDNMPALATGSYSIAVGDFARAYVVVDRQGVRVLRNPYLNAPFVHFYTTKRVGGGIQDFDAVKLLQFAA